MLNIKTCKWQCTCLADFTFPAKVLCSNACITKSYDNNNKYCPWKKVTFNYICTTLQMECFDVADGSLARQRSLREILGIVTHTKSQHAFLFRATESFSTARSHLLQAPLSLLPLVFVLLVELPPCQLSASQAVNTRLLKWLCIVQ